ncbi:MAG: mechanosensitive ion channel family protein [Gammaproteobacteria bacterium]
MKIIRCLFSTFLLCFFVSVATVGGVALAQTEGSEIESVEVPEALGPDAMSALVSKLDEKQTAALVELIQLLNSSAISGETVAVVKQPPAIDIIRGWFTDFGRSLKSNVQSLPETIAGIGKAVSTIFEGREAGGNLSFLLSLALVLVAGIAAEWLFNRFTANSREKIRQAHPETLLETFRTLSTRAGIEIGGVIVFTLVALISTNIFVQQDNDRFLISAFILNAILIVRLFGAILHFILAPRRPELRLVYTDTWTALYIERNFKLLAGVVGVGFFLVAVMQKNGIAIDTFRFWVGLAIHLWIIIVTLKARKGLTLIIKGDDDNLTPGLERMAGWWPALSAAVVAFNWFFLQFTLSVGNQELSPQRSVSAIVLIIMAPFLDTIVRGLAAHMVPTTEGKGEVAEKAYEATRLCYIRVGRILLIGFLIIVIGKLWGINLRNLAESGFGAQVAANGVAFLLILALGYLAWEVTNLWINKRLAKEIPEGEGDVEGGTGQTRIATILPIMRMTVQATIIIITVLLALSELGVNIAPLLAGAGVLGLAIGFGAQTLVKDIVSGVFFLLDDAFRLGEFIEVGTTMGIVEKISVRSLQLRSALGAVHIIPYGSMSQLTNNSRDWVTMKLKFTIPFDTDLEKVRKIFKKIGQELQEVPEHAAVLINPFKSQGAADVTDVGIVIRGKFTTVPGGQWQIRKEIYSRVQKAFEENGIEFARKEVRVQLPEHMDPGNLTEDQKKVVSAAASQAAEPDVVEGSKG